MTIEVPNVPQAVLLDHRSHAESSTSIRKRVCAARACQVERSDNPNSQLTNKEIDRYCRLTETDTRLLGSAIDRLGFSRAPRIASSRSLARLRISNAEMIYKQHI